MAGIKVSDIAWGRLRSPDLDLQEKFLVDFGMVRAARTKTALYMRGTDPHHHLHVTERGEPGFIGLAYYLAREEDLQAAARLPGASAVEAIDEPGGGRRVRLKDPHGYQIELIWGQDAVEPLPVRPNTINWGSEKYRRAGSLCRLPPGASQVKRIGHGVLMTTKLAETLSWYRETLGLIASDDVYIGEDKTRLMGSFNRCDRGDDYVDHHVFFAINGDKIGLNHLSFEVQDIDDVMIGHEYLGRQGYEHMWGIGRHVLGSQIYDYWADPWRRVHEHWTDSDVLNVHNGSNLVSAEEGLRSQWGEAPPEKFIHHASP